MSRVQKKTLIQHLFRPIVAHADEFPAGNESETINAAQNPGFELKDSKWRPTGWTLSHDIYVTNSAAHSGSYALRVDQWNNDATLTQEVREPAGMYDVSIYAWANESLGDSRLVVNGKQTTISSNGGHQIDGSKTWSQVVVQGVGVPEGGGSLHISLIIPRLTSETLEGYLDDLTITKSTINPNDAKPDHYIGDNGFENGLTGWKSDGAVVSSEAHSGSKSLDQGLAGTHDTSQTISDLPAGSYTLTAFVCNSGGEDHAYLYARQAATVVKASIVRTTFPFENRNAWVKVYLRGFTVQKGAVTIGVHTESSSVARLLVDDLHLVKDTVPTQFLQGGDISELTYAEDEGAHYYDAAGVQQDPLAILAKEGWNFARIRIYNNPGKGRGNGSYYCPQGYVNVTDALRLARRAAKYGMKIELTFHYSDYWTNPGAQIVPKSWQKLVQGRPESQADQILTNQVGLFTADVLKKMAAQGTLPQYVSLGNETRSGMLLPYGSTSNWPVLANMYNAGARAVRQYDPTAKIILHIDNGGDATLYTTYFSQAIQNKVDFDIIGASFYPHWTNRSGQDFTRFANIVTAKFRKPIIIMEAAANWNPTIKKGVAGQLGTLGPYGPNSQSSPGLQRQIMDDIFNSVKAVDNGYGLGVLYWDPVFVHSGGHLGWAVSEANDIVQDNAVENTTLFDFDGKALPVMDSFDDNSTSTDSPGVYGRVLDQDGNPVANALVSAGTKAVTTDRFGGYYMPLTSGKTKVTIDVESQEAGQAQSDIDYTGGRQSVTDIRLPGRLAPRHLQGTVKDVSGHLLADALIAYGPSGSKRTTYTDRNGSYTLNLPASSKGKVTASQNRYVDLSVTIQPVSAGSTQTLDFILSPNQGDHNKSCHNSVHR